MKKVVNLAYGSVAIGVVVLALKSYAYMITGSLALYSDALESIVNVVASMAMLIAVRLSTKPADATHHYGHYKAEYFSAIFEGIIIVIVAISIFYSIYDIRYNPSHHIEVPMKGLLLNGGATLLNGLWGWVMIKCGRLYRSPAIIADGKHLLSDVVTSICTALGVAVMIVTGMNFLDPLIALGLATYLLWVGWHIMQDSIAGLMDAAPDKKEVDKIKKIIKDNYKGAIEAHDLRVRRAGHAMFVDFHLVVTGDMTVRESHDICDNIENAIKKKFDSSIITIHVEPENKVKQGI